MFPSYPHFRPLTNEDRERYNFYYFLQDEPNSDYCFSVIQTWLAFECPVEVTQIDEGLIALKYCDVLFDDKNTCLYALIGKEKMLTPKEADKILELTDDNTRLVLSNSQLKKLEKYIDSSFTITSDLGMNDYIYSVEDYTNLDKPDYRRIRRELNIFNRDHPGAAIELEQVDVTHPANCARVLNIHHTWEDTYKFQNDPERIEGLIMSRILGDAVNLGVNCVIAKINDVPEGIFIYSDLPMKSGHFVNLHHARFSYRYKHINDILWVHFAQFIGKNKAEYINFERDANIDGLRQHKLLLKPKKINSMHLIWKSA